MNAADCFARALPPDGLRRIAVLEPRRFGEPAVIAAFAAPARSRRHEPVDLDEALVRVAARWRGDLCGLLNALVRGELAAIARAHGVSPDGSSPELRARLWTCGAAIEAGDAIDHVVDAAALAALQPRPVVIGGHLVVQAPPRGLYPPSATWPRAVPAPSPAAPPADEPDTLDDLLAAADRALGVRLGPRGADKGAWGLRAAALLGVVERGAGEPDWRGDVEVKTVPIARDPSGLWRVVEDPAIAMTDEHSAIAKLQRTLWLARAGVAAGGAAAPGATTDATLVSWYLLEWDAPLARLARRYLHERPKGPAGTDQRGVYLHKRFFADAGLLATLNGPGAAA